MWAAGTLLTSAAVVHPFAVAVGVSLEANARLLMALAATVWLLAPHGLAAGHFGWDAGSVHHAWRATRRFTAFFVPLIFVSALNGLDHAPYANRETLARLFFVAAMVVLAVLVVRLFRRTSPLMQRLAEVDPQGWARRLYPAWYGTLLAFPLGMLGLALAGYLTAAGYFFGRTTLTLVLLIIAGVLYGMVALWVQMRQFMLAGQPAAPHSGAAGEAAAAQPPQKVNLAAMGEQTRSLLDVTLTVLLLAGLWWAWKDALPALSAIGDSVIWSFAATDKEPASSLTVGEVFLAIGIAALTWVAVRNIGALLDTLLLQRLAFQSDANYAIKVMARYALTAVGVLMASSTLGISWGSVQWLIAALGVGLGFGLQEIVANFVSGLIVLAERPVRVGDTVTVNGVTGKVSAIRARSTRVIDADNKEVIIPNKAFITERVVNWTLPDKSTRLLLPVRVAHGADIARVQQLLLDAVRGNADIQSAPAPSVYFTGLGDNSLDFEIRAYVDSLDERLRVQHALYVAVLLALRDNGIELPQPAGR
jgi:potassium efflux system protein